MRTILGVLLLIALPAHAQMGGVSVFDSATGHYCQASRVILDNGGRDSPWCERGVLHLPAHPTVVCVPSAPDTRAPVSSLVPWLFFALACYRQLAAWARR